MDTKRTVKWWKVVLLAALAGLFLLLFVTGIPMTLLCRDSFLWDCHHSPDFFSEHATLYHFYLNFQVFSFSMAAFSLYGLLRCFRPAAQPRGDVGKLRRRWTWAGLACLLVNLAILAYMLLSREPPDNTGLPANGGSYTTAEELIFYGWLLFGMILSLDGEILSLIRRRELKSVEASDGLQ